MKLKDYVPFFISNIKEFQSIFNSEQIELDKINVSLQEILNQFFVSTATFSLSDWEEFVGIDKNTSKSIKERRSRILAKLRGQGTTTVEMIRDVCKSYIKDIEVIEHPKTYSFEINLKSNNGFSSLLEDLYNSIEEIKPAHLGVNYKLTSITNMNVFYGSFINTGETITVYPYNIKSLECKGKVNISLGNDVTLENVTIYPRKEEK